MYIWNRNTNRAIVVALVATLGIALGTAHAQTEQIPPTLVFPGQPLELWYDNEIPPGGTFKVLQFVGEAQSFGSTGLLEIIFDYDDPVYGSDSLSQGQFAIPPTLTTVSAGPWTLDFCPERVSIHFIAIQGEIEVQGAFDHSCVPEPAAAMMFAPAMLLLRRRF